MARPKNIVKTTTKTYVFYEEDIKEIQELGLPTKQIFKLGLQAYKNGYSPAKENKEVEDLKNRIKGMSYTLQSYIDKFNKLALIIEKKWNIEISPDIMKTDKLDELLEELEK